MPSHNSVIDSILGRALEQSAVAKQGSIQSASEKKREAIQSKTESRRQGYMEAARTSAGLDPTPDSRDIMESLLDPNNAEKQRGMSEYINDRTSNRSDMNMVNDSIGGMATTAFTGLGKVVEAGVGLFSDEGARVIGDGVQEVDDYHRSRMSYAQQARQRAMEARMEATAPDRIEKIREDINSGDSNLMLGLKWVGREAMDAIKQSADDDVVFATGITDGLGSMAAGGAMGKAIGVAGSAVTRRLAIGAGGPSALAFRADKAVKAASMPTAIGALEGGAAYHEVFQQIQDTDFSELEQNSSEYRSLVDAGLSPEQARLEVAGIGARRALAIAGPAGAASGMLVSKFEANPLAAMRTRGVMGNILKEGLEEGIQGATGGFATNKGLQVGNEEQSLIEGLGEQVGLGALYGMGAAGAIQGPGLVTRKTGQGLSKIWNASADKVSERVENVRKGNEASSEFSDEEIAQAREKYRAEKDDLRAEAVSAVEESDASPEAKSTGLQYIDDLFNKASEFDYSQHDNAVTNPELRESLREAVDTFDALGRITDFIETSDNEADVLWAGALINQIVKGNERLVGDQFLAAMEAVPEDHPILPKMRQVENILLSYHMAPKVKAATEKANSLALKVTEDLSETDGTRQYSADEVEAVTRTASTNPDKVSGSLADSLLDDHGSGKIQLTDEQIINLRAASNLARASRASISMVETLGMENVDDVSNEILDNEAEASVVAYMRAITDAVVSGNTEAAKERLGRFMGFAQHMQNKLGALNESLETGKKSKFQARRKSDGKWYDGVGNIVHPTNANSIALAHQMAVEAGVVADVANDLAQMFPDLGIQPVVKTELDARLRQPANKIIEQFSKPKVDDKAEAKPEPVVVETEAVTPAEGSNKTEDTPEEAPLSVPESERRTSEGQDQATTEAAETAQPKGGDQSAYVDVSEMKNSEISSEIDKMLDDTPFDMLSDEQTKRFQDLTGELQRRINKPEADKIALLGDEALNAELNALMDKGLDNLSKKERNRFNLLDEEMTRREDSAVATPETAEPSSVEGGDTSTETDSNSVEETGTEAAKQSQKEEAKPEQSETVEEPAQSETDRTAGTDTDLAGDTVDAPLITDKVKGLVNWFAKAFKSYDSPRSRLAGVKNPLAVFRDILASPARIASFIGAKPKLSSDTLTEYQGYLKLAEPIKDMLQKRLDAFLEDEFGSKKKGTNVKFRDMILEGKNTPNTLPRAKVLNIVRVSEDGKFTYDREMLELAVLAALQWSLVADQHTVPVDKEMAAEILGVTEEEAVLLLDQFQGMSPIEASESLAATIQRFWGLQQDNSVDMGHAEGLLQGLAKELLSAMAGITVQGKPMAEVVPLENPYRDNLTRWLPMRLAPEHPLKNNPNLIEEMIVIEAERAGFEIGQAPSRVPKFQLRSKIVQLKAMQRQAIRAAQETPHFVNTRMVNFYQAIGAEGAVALFGEGKLDNRNLNVNDRASRDGKNRTIHAAFDQVLSTVSEVANQGDLESTSIFYRYEMSRTNRMQMQGAHNPQASKVAREAILPTWSTLDIAGNPDHKLFFFMALAQAMGVKIHQKSPQASIQEVIQKLEAMPEVLELLSGDMKSLDGNAVAKIRAQLGKGEAVAPVALHAAMEYARFKKASAKERAAFKTALYVEADGVTNGPVNSMLMLTSGEFTAEWIENAKKGGLFLDGTPSMNSHRQTTDGSTDMYQSVSNILQRLLTQSKNNSNSQAYKDQLVKLVRLMDLLGMDLEIDEKGNLVIDRGTAKNPLTITIYGSGEKGIAGNITASLLEALYKKMSDALENQSKNEGMSEALAMFGDKANGDEQLADQMYGDLREALDSLLTTQIKKTREGKIYAQSTAKMRDGKKAYRGKNGMEDMTYDRIDFQSIQENMLTLFVGPMRAAIDEALAGNVQSNAQMLRTATQIQSIFLQRALSAEISKLVEAKKAANPDYKTSDFISKNELQELLLKVLETHPLVEGEHQNIFISGSENVHSDYINGVQSEDGKRKSYVNFGTNLRDRIKTQGSVRVPTNAGVAGVPLMVISMGDGHMIQFMLTMDGAPEGTLPVFDGVHMKLDTVRQDSPKINEAAYAAWMNNPIKAVAASYEKFRASYSGIDFNDFGLLVELGKAIFGPQFSEGDLNVESVFKIQNSIDMLAESLGQAAREIDARHQVLSEFELTVDQMASVGIPHKRQGTSLAGKTSAEIADILTARYNEIMGVEPLTPAQVEERKAQQKKQEKLEAEYAKDNKQRESKIAEDPATLQRFGRAKQGIKVYSQNALKKLLGRGSLALFQKTVLKEILRNFVAKDYTILVGDHDKMARFLGNTQEEIDQLTAEFKGKRGFHNLDSKTIGIFERGGPETMIHELVHASTFAKVLDHYVNGSDAETTTAIENIENLMEQFQKLDISKQDSETLKVYDHTVRTIEKYLAEGTADGRARALNEFMAYTLANRKLAKLTGGKKVSGISNVISKALDQIKRLIFGRKAPIERVNEQMFTSLLFNTTIILQSKPKIGEILAQGQGNLNDDYGNDSRLADIAKTIQDKIGRWVAQNFEERADLREAVKLARNEGVQKAYSDAIETSKLFIQQGFDMTMQESATFRVLVGAFASAVELDPVVANRFQEYFAHVEKHLKVRDFMADPDSDSQSDRDQAQRKYNTLMGVYGTKTDKAGRSSIMPSFVALATTNSEFRAILAGLPPLKGKRDSSGTVDAAIENFGASLMERLSRLLTGERANEPSVQTAMDALMDTMLKTAKERENFLERATKPVDTLVDKGNDWMINGIKKLSDKGMEVGRRVKDNSNNRFVKLGGELTEAISGLLNEENSRGSVDAVISGVNRTNLPRPIRDILTDFIGRTDSNASVYDMIKLVRSTIQKSRQQFREHLPTVIAKEFSRPLTEAEQTLLYKGMAETDLAMLRSAGMKLSEIVEMLQDPAKLQAKIKETEKAIQTEDAGNWQMLEKKSRQLANYMLTKEHGSNLLSNAYAVASLANEKTTAKRGVPSSGLVKNIDVLVSLYALEGLDQNTKSGLSSLAQAETNGVSFALAYLDGRRRDEMKKAQSGFAKTNHYKGYVPSEQRGSGSIIVADRTPKNHARLLGMSYEYVGPYKGSSLDSYSDKLGYYYLPVAARAGYEQGIMQTVRMTASGVDAQTGYTLDGTSVGRITDFEAVRRITRNLGREQGDARLKPIFNEAMEVIAYERTMDPSEASRVKRSSNLAEMLGVWKGRQIEEALANEFNTQLVDRLKKMYDDDISKDVTAKREYVNLFSKQTDPVIADSMKLMPPEMREYIRDTFGSQFLVRKDMLNQVIGYRSASVGDLWTGTSRWSPKTQKTVRDLTISVFGNAAYRKLLVAETTLENVVVDAKVIIVVKSVIVPMMNFASNILQMASRGIPLAYIAAQLPKKLAEVDGYVRSHQRLMAAEAELGAVENDPTASRRLRAEIRTIKDSHRNLSIWPLIEAGEFNSISDIDVSREDVLLSSGRLNDYMENLVDKLPPSLKTLGKYGWIARDTALFKGLHRSIEYGDFLAKAVLYDHRTKRKGMSQEAALAKITEEFVNYDYLPGRFRGKLEDLGLMWFWNFKIRSTKVAWSIIRDNPLHALLASFMPMPEDSGSPMEDNALSVIFRGDAGWSIGPEMGIRSPFLHPTLNVIT